MTGILLTKSSTLIIGPVAELLGMLMNGIFAVLEKVGISNIGLSIIIFTIIIYLCLMPLTIKQQKFSKLSAKMNPELQAIQKKYKGKKDNDSMMRMNEETQAVYRKYGVSPTGSCLQLVIQMPILFALYQVIYRIPAYVTSVRDVYDGFVPKLMEQSGSSKFMEGLKSASQFSKQFSNEQFVQGSDYMKNTFIDVLNKASSSEWQSVIDKFGSVGTDIQNALDKLNVYNNFLGLNIGNSPSYTIKQAFGSGDYLLIVAALMIPVLSALTQFINVKLMPQAPKSNDGGQMDTMQATMKSMNVMMPLMSAIFCFTLPTGMGIYWIAGAIVRSIQQVLINRHIDRIDFDELIKKNLAKAKEKEGKKSLASSLVDKAVGTNVKAIESPSMSEGEKEEAIKNASEAGKNAKPGSISHKSNMVREFNNRNNTK